MQDPGPRDREGEAGWVGKSGRESGKAAGGSFSHSTNICGALTQGEVWSQVGQIPALALSSGTARPGRTPPWASVSSFAKWG